MKMSKIIPVFILLFTGPLCKVQGDVTSPMAMTSELPTLSPTERALSPPIAADTTQSSAAEPTSGSGNVPERRLSTPLVAGISIAFVALFILIVAAFWYARKKTTRNLAQMNPDNPGEPAVSLRTFSVHGN